MHGLSCLRKLHLAGQPQQLPVQRVQNTIVPVIRGWFLVFFAVVSLVYLGTFVAAWNHSFATSIELILWRAASLTALLSAFGAFIIQPMFFQWIPSIRRSLGANSTQPTEDSSEKKHNPRLRALRTKFNAFVAILRNNSTTQDPAFNAPVGAILMTYFFGIFYLSARTYIMVADLWELRLLSASAYESLNWSSLAPYVP